MQSPSFMGLFMSITIFFSVIIDIEQCAVETCDSYHTGKGISDFITDLDDDSDSKGDADIKILY